MEIKSRMYTKAKTWNPFKGCLFQCVYCKPSFQKQAKRQKQKCMDCYKYVPHCHETRLQKVPSGEIIFVCGNGDISFCDREFTLKIIKSIKEHNMRCPHKTYYFQSKRPAYFEDFLMEFPNNVILLTTLETNRDSGYDKVSRAPLPSERCRQFLNLDYPRKVVTIEPVMDFDVDVFPQWIVDLHPEYVWLGYNSRHTQVQVPEPSEDKFRELVRMLAIAGVQIRGKELRGVEIDSPPVKCDQWH